MKRYILSLSILVLLATTLSSCKNDNSTNNTINTLKQGKWKVTMYNDSGDDETYHFTGYEFTFNNDGAITAVKGATTVTGTYSKGNDDSRNKLILNFNAGAPFDELNDDWDILEETSNKIRLQDVSGGNGGTDLLTFEKI